MEISQQLSSKPTICLGVVFEGALPDGDAIADALRAFHPSTRSARCEVDDDISKDGNLFGMAEWDEHAVQLVGMNVKMPSSAIEQCVAAAHFPQELKELVRAHGSHILLFYRGTAADVLRQYMALATVAGALASCGALAVLNESAHTSLPAGVLFHNDPDDDNVDQPSALLLLLYCGFIKYEVEGVAGVWMRTHGADLFALPDLAVLAEGHHQGEHFFDIFGNVLWYQLDTGASIASGHTMQIDEDVFLRFRSPSANEVLLDWRGSLLVVEEVRNNPQKSNPFGFFQKLFRS